MICSPKETGKLKISFQSVLHIFRGFEMDKTAICVLFTYLQRERHFQGNREYSMYLHGRPGSDQYLLCGEGQDKLLNGSFSSWVLCELPSESEIYSSFNIQKIWKRGTVVSQPKLKFFTWFLKQIENKVRQLDLEVPKFKSF